MSTSSIEGPCRALTLVAALDAKRGIGRDGKLPWSLAADLAHFRKLTREAPSERINALLMGRRTWQSLPQRPLAGRLNVVLSQQPPSLPDGVYGASSMDDALRFLWGLAELHRVFVIGGESVYRDALSMPEVEGLELTRIDAEWPCDVFFPDFEDGFVLARCSETMEAQGLRYRFERWQRR